MSKSLKVHFKSIGSTIGPKLKKVKHLNKLKY